MSQPIGWQVIDRYLAGVASLAERDAVETWMRASPANQMLVDAARKASESGAPASWDVDSAWARVQERLDGAPVRRLSVTPSVRSPVKPWLIAAGLLLVAGPFVAWRLATRHGTESIAMREVVTPNGKRTTIDLGDGSRVTLNSGSRLRYAADLTLSRDVQLDGEGYFEVVHDAARPFRVHARGGLVQDIGTRFTVRAYPELQRVEVIVSDGVVSLRRDSSGVSDSAIVKQGERARLAETGQVAVESVSTGRYTDWASGTLVLENVTLGEACHDLERWFDIQITLADSGLAKRQLMARFQNESASAVLTAIGIALDVRVEERGRTFTIKQRP
jgi:ferric-dicitrate binding protein FerR (iron transport regulator)